MSRLALLMALSVLSSACGGIVQTPTDAPDAAPDAGGEVSKACAPYWTPTGSGALYDYNVAPCDPRAPSGYVPVAPSDIPRTDIPIDHFDGGQR